jgi:TP901 family phage tail tape measure protein
MALEQAGVQLIAQGAASYLNDLKSAENATNGFIDSTDKGSGRINAAGQVMVGALRQVGSIAVEAFAKAAKATAAFVGDSINLAGDFEAGMLNFQAVAGKDVDAKGLEQFRDLFLDIGKRLPVSTADVQQAAIEMVKGGIDPAIIAAGGLERNIQFAAAAMDGDLAQAAEISAKILGGWTSAAATAQERTDFLTHSTDLMTKAANASAVDVKGLSQGIFNAQGIAKTAGVSFDDLTTTLATLAPRFASSSEAGNSLKNMIARLQPTTDPATDAMQGLGLYTEKTGSAFYDAQGNFVGFQKAAQLLQDSLKGLTKEQQAATLQQIFGNDAMGSAAALADLGAAGYQSMADAMAQANGVAENAALKQQGYNTALDNAKGSVEALQITIGSYLLPVLTDLLNNYIAPGINAFTDWTDSIFSAADPLLALVQSVDSLAPGLGSIIGYITTLVTEGDSLNDFLTTTPPLFQGVVAVVQNLNTFLRDNVDLILGVGAALGSLAILTTVAGWIGGAVAAVASLGAAFTAAGGGIAGVVALLGGPVTLAIAGVAAAVGILTVAWQNDWGGIQEKAAAAWAVAEPILHGLVDWLAEKIPPAIKTLSSFWTDTLQPALAAVWSFLQGKVFPVLSDLADVYIAAAIIEVKALATLWTSTLQPALAAVWSFMSGTLIPIFKALFEVEFAIAAKVVEALAGLWQKVLWPALKSVGDIINTTVLPGFKFAGDYLSATFGPTLNNVTKWLGDITGGFNGVSGAVDFVVGKLHEFADGVSSLKLPSWLTPGSPTPWEIALYGIGKALQTSVAPGLSNMQRGVAEIGAQISDSFASTDLVDKLSSLGEDVMAGFGQGLTSGMRGVIRVINSTADTVEGAFNDTYGRHSPAKRMIPIGEDVSRGVMVGIENLVPAMIGLVDQTGTTMIDALKKNVEAGGDAIRKMMDDLTKDIKDIGDQINNAIADSFGGTASIDRQIAKNLDRFKDVPDAYKQYTEGALKQAQAEAEAMPDRAEGAKYFKMRSDQILEYAKLQQDLAQAQKAIDDAFAVESDPSAALADQETALATQRQAQADIERIQQQMALINAAQAAELSGYEAGQRGQTAPQQDIAAEIEKLFQGDALRDKLPGALENEIMAQLMGLLGQLQTPANTRADAYANPPMMPQQAGGGGVTSNTSNTQTFNMPIYTNNSPAALQQSWQVMQASMP